MSKAIIILKEKHIIKTIKESNFFHSKPIFKSKKVKIEEVLPFRVKFINIGIVGYGPRNAAPIGIAIIGVNNYVM